MPTTLRILMLEDSDPEAEMIQRLLKKELPTCIFQLVADKKSFLSALETFSPDIVLSDNALPQYSGSEALKTVRQRSPSIPFILITGTATDEFAATIMKAGADDYILKDRLERLPSAITTAIKKRKTEQALKDYQEEKVQQQKKITRAIIEAQEKERNHIGRELHDNVNQILATTTLYLGMAAKNNTDAKELISYSIGLVNNAIDEIRALSARHVTPLKDIKLEQLIGELLKTPGGIQTKFRYNADIDDDELKLNLYRIIQEQVNNIVKHAQATTIEVLIEATEHNLLVEVTDDGKGFDPKQKRNGIGISNMMNRIESFNGEMSILSRPGEGCKIRTRIPI